MLGHCRSGTTKPRSGSFYTGASTLCLASEGMVRVGLIPNREVRGSGGNGVVLVGMAGRTAGVGRRFHATQLPRRVHVS